MNHVYRIAVIRAKVFDVEARGQDAGVALTAKDGLRRARIASRDADAARPRNGIGAPEAGTICLGRRGVERTAELVTFAAEC